MTVLTFPFFPSTEFSKKQDITYLLSTDMSEDLFDNSQDLFNNSQDIFESTIDSDCSTLPVGYIYISVVKA